MVDGTTREFQSGYWVAIAELRSNAPTRFMIWAVDLLTLNFPRDREPRYNELAVN